MEDKNILQVGMAELDELKDDLVKKQEYEERLNNVKMNEKETGDRLDGYEREVCEEVENTVKRRERELVEGFDRSINEESKKLKNANSGRKKAKRKGQKERIKEETKKNEEEIIRLNREIGAEFRAKGVPYMCNNTFYYAMYFTKTLKDWIIFIITTITCLGLIPGIIDIITSWHWIIKTIVHIFIVVVFITIYITVWLSTKDRYSQVIGDMRDKRDDIAMNKKIIRDIKKKIKEDKDEEMYNLNEYDEEIAGITQRMHDISCKRKEAVEEFENKTKPDIIKDIEGKYQKDIDEHKMKLDALIKERRELEDKCKELDAHITAEYKAYIGEEYLDVAVVDEMKKIMEEQNMATISEVIKYMEEQYT